MRRLKALAGTGLPAQKGAGGGYTGEALADHDAETRHDRVRPFSGNPIL